MINKIGPTPSVASKPLPEVEQVIERFMQELFNLGCRLDVVVVDGYTTEIRSLESDQVEVIRLEQDEQ